MFTANHTIVHGGNTFAPGNTLTASDLDGADIDRLIELKAISQAEDAGMPPAEKKTAKKSAAEAKKAAAAADDGLDG